MECKNCKTTTSPRWRKGYCDSCYLKRWRKNNHDAVLQYSKDLKVRFRHVRRLAKRRKIDWHLSLEEYATLCEQACFYCENKLGEKVSQGLGLDRIDNSRGYISGNILPCCRICNTIRNDILSVEETKEVIKLVINLRNL